MNNIHIQLNYEDSLNAKRNSLLIQENLLTSLVHLKKYNQLRRIEFSLKNKIKKDFFELSKILISLQEQFPKEEATFAESLSKKSQKKEMVIQSEQKIKKTLKETTEKRNTIEDEIEEIRKKLAQLS